MPLKYDWNNIAPREVDQVARSRMLNEVIARIAPYTNAMTGEALADAGLAEVLAGSIGGVSSAGSFRRYETPAAKYAASYTGATILQNVFGRRLEYTADGVLFECILDEREGVFNPRARGAKADSGASVLTAQDIADNAALPATALEKWLGTYIAGDTWDYVGLNEAILRAAAGLSSTPGSVVWNGSAGSTSNARIVIPPGNYDIGVRELGISSTLGLQISGAGPHCTVIRGRNRVLYTNGVAKMAVRGISFLGYAYTGSSLGFWTAAQPVAVGTRCASTTRNAAYYMDHALPGELFEALDAGTTGATVADEPYWHNGQAESNWTVNTVVTAGSFRKTVTTVGSTPSGTVMRCVTGGTTGAAEPAWAAAPATTNDNGVVWKEVNRDAGGIRWLYRGLRKVVDINWDGAGGIGNQGNTFQDCRIESTNADSHNIGFSIGDGLTGMGSEFTLLNVHVMWFKHAGIYTNDFDAYQIAMHGGNISECPVYGIHVRRGGVSCYGTGFQNGTYHTQLGHDVQISNCADTIGFQGYFVRSESAKLLNAQNSAAATYFGLEHIPNGVYGASYFRSQTPFVGFRIGTLMEGEAGAGPNGWLYEATAITKYGTGLTATGATSTTVTVAGAGWGVNAHAGRTIEGLTGGGVGTRRTIASNTSDTLTLTASASFAVGSTFDILGVTSATVPNFEAGGATVTDGDVTWTYREIPDMVVGQNLTLVASQFSMGLVTVNSDRWRPASVISCMFNRSDWNKTGASFLRLGNAVVKGGGWSTGGYAIHEPPCFGTGFAELKGYLAGSATVDFPSIAAGAYGAAVTVAVVGALRGMFARASHNQNTGLILHATVTANDTVTVTPYNPTAGPLDIASGTLYATVIKST